MGYLSFRWLITTLSFVGVVCLAIGIVLDNPNCQPQRPKNESENESENES